MDINKEIEKEIKRLDKVFINIQKNKKDTVDVLIENVAFMRVQMKVMKDRINTDGTSIKYQNGENQWGFKKSPDVDTYNSFIKQCTSIVKQLTDLLPVEVEKSIKDEIQEWI